MKQGLKVAVTGKGGVGKTTLTSLLAYAYLEQGFKVLAIDADPSPCLGATLGFPPDLTAQLTPIAQMDDLIFERTGAKPGATGGYFKINPRVDDIPDRFSVEHRGIRLLELGAVDMGGAGCICPESAVLRALMTYILLQRNEVVLMDMYAGVEHLGRATADAVDAMIVVVEPTLRSLATAEQIRSLASDIKLARIFLVGSKVQGDADREFIAKHSPDLPIIGHLSDDPRVRQADRDGVAVFDAVPELAAMAGAIIEQLGEPS